MNTAFFARTCRRLGGLCLVGAVLGLAGAPATAQDGEAAVVSAPKILEALSKDIVLDTPGKPRRAANHGAKIDLQVQFGFDSAQLMGQGKRQLDALAMALQDKALRVSGFELAGHTDRVGDADYNIKLSLARANAVRAYLAEVHGVSAARLQTIGYGFARLADPFNPTAASNRRVEVRRIGAPARADAPPAQGGQLVPTPN
ncbi:MAG: OmpA family protein [Pseudomonadota bacterium]